MGGKPSAPTPPNPTNTLAAANTNNIGSTIANAFLNNTNQYTPEGSLRYDQTGSYSWTDPLTGTTSDIPRFSATQQYSPQQQKIMDQINASKYNMAGLSNSLTSRLQNQLAGPLDLNSAPQAGDPNSIFGDDKFKTSIDPSWDIKRTFGDEGDISKVRDQYTDALMGRMNPQLEKERGNIEQRMSDQGIRYGSGAYTGAMDDYNRQANDARLAAIGAGGDEMTRMWGLAQSKAQFENAAQNQDFSQKALQANFANQGLGQNLAMSTAKFNAFNTARNQYMQEQYAARNQPINEINSLLNGSQVQSPNFVNTPNNQIPTTDVAGLVNTQFSQQMDVYKQESQNYNAMMGGIMGMVSGGMKMGMSDERMKEDIVPVGSVLTAKKEDDEPKMGTVMGADDDKKELPIYEYSFKHDPQKTRHVGPMAQDVQKIDKKAVKTIGGIKYVDHGRVMGSILRAG